MLLFECNPTAVFDDNNLPEDSCEDGPIRFPQCATNIIIGWGVGGDDVSFQELLYINMKSHFNIACRVSKGCWISNWR